MPPQALPLRKRRLGQTSLRAVLNVGSRPRREASDKYRHCLESRRLRFAVMLQDAIETSASIRRGRGAAGLRDVAPDHVAHGIRSKPGRPSDRLSRTRPHPEVPKRNAGLEGVLQESQRSLDGSFETVSPHPRLRGVGRITRCLDALSDAEPLTTSARDDFGAERFSASGSPPSPRCLATTRMDPPTR